MRTRSGFNYFYVAGAGISLDFVAGTKGLTKIYFMTVNDVHNIYRNHKLC